CSRVQVSVTLRSPLKHIASFCPPSQHTSSQSNKGRARLGRHTSRFPKGLALLCAKKCVATWVIRADQSGSKSNTGSRVDGGNGRLGHASSACIVGLSVLK